jgi:hypothetical protein
MKVNTHCRKSMIVPGSSTLLTHVWDRPDAHREERGIHGRGHLQRGSHLLPTYWSESTLSSR